MSSGAWADSLCGRRRGSAYALVLGVSLLVVVIGAGAVAVGRIEARASAEDAALISARLHALSGIELARLWIASDSNWRTNRSNGVWVSDQVIGDGKVTIEVVNPAGALNRSASDPVVVTVTAKSGRAIHKVQLTLTPAATMSCLEAAVAVAGSINLNSSTVLGANQLIASNGSVTALLATIKPNVEAVSSITGLTYAGSTRSGVAARAFPAASIFTTYGSAGTPILFSSLPSGGGSGRFLNNCVLSPGDNPFSPSKNPAGIYVIDCGGDTLTIQNLRIVGTLVLLNVGSGSSVQGSVNWVPATAGLPCLLVQGDLTLSTSGSVLDENASPKTNYNPNTTPNPYSGGSGDGDKSDTYPSVIDGLVYVSGKLSTSNAPTVDCLIVGGTWSAGGTLTLNYDPALYQTPPPGFGGGSMAPALGSWKQDVN